jgi:hypothetical protein
MHSNTCRLFQGRLIGGQWESPGGHDLKSLGRSQSGYNLLVEMLNDVRLSETQKELTFLLQPAI